MNRLGRTPIHIILFIVITTLAIDVEIDVEAGKRQVVGRVRKN